MALFNLNAPAPAPDGSGEDIVNITVGETVMFRIDAQGNTFIGGALVAEGLTVNGVLALQAVAMPFPVVVPGQAQQYKDAADGQVKILNDDGLVYTLTAAPVPTRPA